jgi:hypothetical protein
MKIYLAAPYTAELPTNSRAAKKLMKKRFNAATKKTGELLNQGHIVLCPIVHYHPVAEVCKLPRDWEFWKKIDEILVEWCDELYVYMLEGWDKSIGTKAEIKKARELGKPILYIFDNEKIC